MADKVTNSQILLVFSNLLLLTVAASTAYPTIPGTGGFDCSLSDDLTPIRREVYDGGRIFDISHRYTTDMPTWEEAEGLGQFLWLPKSIKNGSLANNSEMKLPTHTGTHVDAPGHVFDHYFDAGFDVDTLDLEVLNGPALLVDVPRDKNITADVMESLHIPRGVRRVLFRTLNTDRKLMFKKEFDTSYVGFMKDGARWLVENTDIKLVGIDYLSVAAFDDLLPSHYVFLEGREIILIEGLKLDDVPAGMYDVHCLPLSMATTTINSQISLLVLFFTLAILNDCSLSSDELIIKPLRREVYGNGRIFDITHRYTPGVVGLGEFIWLRQSMKNGSLYNFSELKLEVHAGTHVDSPGHMIDRYLDAGFDVDTLDLDVLNGPALLVDVPRDNNITAEVMESLHIPNGVKRVLFRTLNTDRKLMFKEEFDSSYVGFMKDGARWLVENTDIKLVGIDYLSAAAFDDLVPAHIAFHENREIECFEFRGKSSVEFSLVSTDSCHLLQEVILVEALKLDDVPAGIYSVHCLPLRLSGAEGSPIRCILIK
ncbi:hypothetical protein Ddye_003575 [Dipteronia dyeriana]|uniref:Cyclase n=1 Tax=Dipteronia dyeriana TaxID=168575 RepID=A0AAD9XT54_9ROSI|nr:hypothetical protein Ddye_003575 [Dipteronia dyeriana]